MFMTKDRGWLLAIISRKKIARFSRDDDDSFLTKHNDSEDREKETKMNFYPSGFGSD